MTTILVWVLVSYSWSDTRVVTYSPPMATVAECVRMQKTVQSLAGPAVKTQCIQINQVVVK